MSAPASRRFRVVHSVPFRSYFFLSGGKVAGSFELTGSGVLFLLNSNMLCSMPPLAVLAVVVFRRIYGLDAPRISSAHVGRARGRRRAGRQPAAATPPLYTV